MKTLLTLGMLFGLLACSSNRSDRKIDSSEWDSFADESFLRWGPSRINVTTNGSPDVMGCYQGKSQEVLEKYKKQYITEGQKPYYWIHVGNCYFVQDHWTKAEFYFRMAIDETKSKHIKSIALNNLGLVQFKNEQWELGRKSLNESIDNAPKFRIPRYNLSQLYLQFGFYDKAIDALNDSVFRGHKDIDVYFSLANAYLHNGDIDEASRYFKMIPKESFKREDIAATYALFLIKQGRIKEAKSVMDDREISGVSQINDISLKIVRLLALKLEEE